MTAPREPEVYIALGSNLGKRADHLAMALDSLAATPGIRVLTVSRFHETEPVGPPPQGPYLNAAARLDVCVTSSQLLDRMIEIETQTGRQRSAIRNTARTLDLDLLFFGSQRIQTSQLTVPHPRLHERSFVLDPLCEIAAGFRHPVLGETVERLSAALRQSETPGSR